jgi:hypothetical protein
VARKRQPPLLHNLVFAGQGEVNEWATTFLLGGAAYCWTPERGRFPRPSGLGKRGKVIVGVDPNDLLGPGRAASP